MNSLALGSNPHPSIHGIARVPIASHGYDALINQWRRTTETEVCNGRVRLYQQSLWSIFRVACIGVHDSIPHKSAEMWGRPEEEAFLASGGTTTNATANRSTASMANLNNQTLSHQLSPLALSFRHKYLHMDLSQFCRMLAECGIIRSAEVFVGKAAASSSSTAIKADSVGNQTADTVRSALDFASAVAAAMEVEASAPNEPPLATISRQNCEETALVDEQSGVSSLKRKSGARGSRSHSDMNLAAIEAARVSTLGNAMKLFGIFDEVARDELDGESGKTRAKNESNEEGMMAGGESELNRKGSITASVASSAPTLQNGRQQAPEEANNSGDDEEEALGQNRKRGPSVSVGRVPTNATSLVSSILKKGKGLTRRYLASTHAVHTLLTTFGDVDEALTTIFTPITLSMAEELFLFVTKGSEMASYDDFVVMMTMIATFLEPEIEEVKGAAEAVDIFLKKHFAHYVSVSSPLTIQDVVKVAKGVAAADAIASAVVAAEEESNGQKHLMSVALATEVKKAPLIRRGIQGLEMLKAMQNTSSVSDLKSKQAQPTDPFDFAMGKTVSISPLATFPGIDDLLYKYLDPLAIITTCYDGAMKRIREEEKVGTTLSLDHVTIKLLMRDAAKDFTDALTARKSQKGREEHLLMLAAMRTDDTRTSPNTEEEEEKRPSLGGAAAAMTTHSNSSNAKPLLFPPTLLESRPPLPADATTLTDSSETIAERLAGLSKVTIKASSFIAMLMHIVKQALPADECFPSTRFRLWQPVQSRLGKRTGDKSQRRQQSRFSLKAKDGGESGDADEEDDDDDEEALEEKQAYREFLQTTDFSHLLNGPRTLLELFRMSPSTFEFAVKEALEAVIAAKAVANAERRQAEREAGRNSQSRVSLGNVVGTANNDTTLSSTPTPAASPLNGRRDRFNYDKTTFIYANPPADDLQEGEEGIVEVDERAGEGASYYPSMTHSHSNSISMASASQPPRTRLTAKNGRPLMPSEVREARILSHPMTILEVADVLALIAVRAYSGPHGDFSISNNKQHEVVNFNLSSADHPTNADMPTPCARFQALLWDLSSHYKAITGHSSMGTLVEAHTPQRPSISNFTPKVVPLFAHINMKGGNAVNIVLSGPRDDDSSSNAFITDDPNIVLPGHFRTSRVASQGTSAAQGRTAKNDAANQQHRIMVFGQHFPSTGVLIKYDSHLKAIDGRILKTQSIIQPSSRAYASPDSKGPFVVSSVPIFGRDVQQFTIRLRRDINAVLRETAGTALGAMLSTNSSEGGERAADGSESKLQSARRSAVGDSQNGLTKGTVGAKDDDDDDSVAAIVCYQREAFISVSADGHKFYPYALSRTVRGALGSGGEQPPGDLVGDPLVLESPAEGIVLTAAHLGRLRLVFDGYKEMPAAELDEDKSGEAVDALNGSPATTATTAATGRVRFGSRSFNTLSAETSACSSSKGRLEGSMPIKAWARFALDFGLVAPPQQQSQLAGDESGADSVGRSHTNPFNSGNSNSSASTLSSGPAIGQAILRMPLLRTPFDRYAVRAPSAFASSVAVAADEAAVEGEKGEKKTGAAPQQTRLDLSVMGLPFNGFLRAIIDLLVRSNVPLAFGMAQFLDSRQWLRMRENMEERQKATQCSAAAARGAEATSSSSQALSNVLNNNEPMRDFRTLNLAIRRAAKLLPLDRRPEEVLESKKVTTRVRKSMQEVEADQEARKRNKLNKRRKKMERQQKASSRSQTPMQTTKKSAKGRDRKLSNGPDYGTVLTGATVASAQELDGLNLSDEGEREAFDSSDESDDYYEDDATSHQRRRGPTPAALFPCPSPRIEGVHPMTEMCPLDLDEFIGLWDDPTTDYGCDNDENKKKSISLPDTSSASKSVKFADALVHGVNRNGYPKGMWVNDWLHNAMIADFLKSVTKGEGIPASSAMNGDGGGGGDAKGSVATATALPPAQPNNLDAHAGQFIGEPDPTPQQLEREKAIVAMLLGRAAADPKELQKMTSMARIKANNNCNTSSPQQLLAGSHIVVKQQPQQRNKKNGGGDKAPKEQKQQLGAALKTEFVSEVESDGEDDVKSPAGATNRKRETSFLREEATDAKPQPLTNSSFTASFRLMGKMYDPSSASFRPGRMGSLGGNNGDQYRQNSFTNGINTFMNNKSNGGRPKHPREDELRDALAKARLDTLIRTQRYAATREGRDRREIDRLKEENERLQKALLHHQGGLNAASSTQLGKQSMVTPQLRQGAASGANRMAISSTPPTPQPFVLSGTTSPAIGVSPPPTRQQAVAFDLTNNSQPHHQLLSPLPADIQEFGGGVGVLHSEKEQLSRLVIMELERRRAVLTQELLLAEHEKEAVRGQVVAQLKAAVMESEHVIEELREIIKRQQVASLRQGQVVQALAVQAAAAKAHDDFYKGVCDSLIDRIRNGEFSQTGRRVSQPLSLSPRSLMGRGGGGGGGAGHLSPTNSQQQQHGGSLAPSSALLGASSNNTNSSEAMGGPPPPALLLNAPMDGSNVSRQPSMGSMGHIPETLSGTPRRSIKKITGAGGVPSHVGRTNSEASSGAGAGAGAGGQVTSQKNSDGTKRKSVVGSVKSKIDAATSPKGMAAKSQKEHDRRVSTSAAEFHKSFGGDGDISSLLQMGQSGLSTPYGRGSSEPIDVYARRMQTLSVAHDKAFSEVLVEIFANELLMTPPTQQQQQQQQQPSTPATKGLGGAGRVGSISRPHLLSLGDQNQKHTVNNNNKSNGGGISSANNTPMNRSLLAFSVLKDAQDDHDNNSTANATNNILQAAVVPSALPTVIADRVRARMAELTRGALVVEKVPAGTQTSAKSTCETAIDASPEQDPSHTLAALMPTGAEINAHIQQQRQLLLKPATVEQGVNTDEIPLASGNASPNHGPLTLNSTPMDGTTVAGIGRRSTAQQHHSNSGEKSTSKHQSNLSSYFAETSASGGGGTLYNSQNFPQQNSMSSPNSPLIAAFGGGDGMVVGEGGMPFIRRLNLPRPRRRKGVRIVWPNDETLDEDGFGIHNAVVYDTDMSSSSSSDEEEEGEDHHVEGANAAQSEKKKKSNKGNSPTLAASFNFERIGSRNSLTLISSSSAKNLSKMRKHSKVHSELAGKHTSSSSSKRRESNSTNLLTESNNNKHHNPSAPEKKHTMKKHHKHAAEKSHTSSSGSKRATKDHQHQRRCSSVGRGSASDSDANNTSCSSSASSTHALSGRVRKRFAGPSLPPTSSSPSAAKPKTTTHHRTNERTYSTSPSGKPSSHPSTLHHTTNTSPAARHASPAQAKKNKPSSELHATKNNDVMKKARKVTSKVLSSAVVDSPFEESNLHPGKKGGSNRHDVGKKKGKSHKTAKRTESIGSQHSQDDDLDSEEGHDGLSQLELKAIGGDDDDDEELADEDQDEMGMGTSTYHYHQKEGQEGEEGGGGDALAFSPTGAFDEEGDDETHHHLRDGSSDDDDDDPDAPPFAKEEGFSMHHHHGGNYKHFHGSTDRSGRGSVGPPSQSRRASIQAGQMHATGQARNQKNNKLFVPIGEEELVRETQRILLAERQRATTPSSLSNREGGAKGEGRVSDSNNAFAEGAAEGGNEGHEDEEAKVSSTSSSSEETDDERYDKPSNGQAAFSMRNYLNLISNDYCFIPHNIKPYDTIASILAIYNPSATRRNILDANFLRDVLNEDNKKEGDDANNDTDPAAADRKLNRILLHGIPSRQLRIPIPRHLVDVHLAQAKVMIEAMDLEYKRLQAATALKEERDEAEAGVGGGSALPPPHPLESLAPAKIPLRLPTYLVDDASGHAADSQQGPAAGGGNAAAASPFDPKAPPSCFNPQIAMADLSNNTYRAMGMANGGRTITLAAVRSGGGGQGEGVGPTIRFEVTYDTQPNPAAAIVSTMVRERETFLVLPHVTEALERAPVILSVAGEVDDDRGKVEGTAAEASSAAAAAPTAVSNTAKVGSPRSPTTSPYHRVKHHNDGSALVSRLKAQLGPITASAYATKPLTAYEESAIAALSAEQSAKPPSQTVVVSSPLLPGIPSFNATNSAAEKKADDETKEIVVDKEALVDQIMAMLTAEMEAKEQLKEAKRIDREARRREQQERREAKKQRMEQLKRANGEGAQQQNGLSGSTVVPMPAFDPPTPTPSSRHGTSENDDKVQHQQEQRITNGVTTATAQTTTAENANHKDASAGGGGGKDPLSRSDDDGSNTTSHSVAKYAGSSSSFFGGGGGDHMSPIGATFALSVHSKPASIISTNAANALLAHAAANNKAEKAEQGVETKEGEEQGKVAPSSSSLKKIEEEKAALETEAKEASHIIELQTARLAERRAELEAVKEQFNREQMERAAVVKAMEEQSRSLRDELEELRAILKALPSSLEQMQTALAAHGDGTDGNAPFSELQRTASPTESSYRNNLANGSKVLRRSSVSKRFTMDTYQKYFGSQLQSLPFYDFDHHHAPPPTYPSPLIPPLVDRGGVSVAVNGGGEGSSTASPTKGALAGGSIAMIAGQSRRMSYAANNSNNDQQQQVVLPLVAVDGVIDPRTKPSDFSVPFPVIARGRPPVTSGGSYSPAPFLAIRPAPIHQLHAAMQHRACVLLEWREMEQRVQLADDARRAFQKAYDQLAFARLRLWTATAAEPGEERNRTDIYGTATLSTIAKDEIFVGNNTSTMASGAAAVSASQTTDGTLAHTTTGPAAWAPSSNWKRAARPVPVNQTTRKTPAPIAVDERSGESHSSPSQKQASAASASAAYNAMLLLKKAEASAAAFPTTPFGSSDGGGGIGRRLLAPLSVTKSGGGAQQQQGQSPSSASSSSAYAKPLVVTEGGGAFSSSPMRNHALSSSAPLTTSSHYTHHLSPLAASSVFESRILAGPNNTSSSQFLNRALRQFDPTTKHANNASSPSRNHHLSPLGAAAASTLISTASSPSAAMAMATSQQHYLAQLAAIAEMGGIGKKEKGDSSGSAKANTTTTSASPPPPLLAADALSSDQAQAIAALASMELRIRMRPK